MRVAIELGCVRPGRYPRQLDMQNLIDSIRALLNGNATGYHRDRAFDVMSILEGLKQELPR